jgi:hypothetical protein
MLDLSVSGAKLKLDANTQLPQQFILVMSRDGRLNRRCQTMWREKDVLGVQFLSRNSLGPKHEEAVRRFAIQIPPEHLVDDAAVPAKSAASSNVPKKAAAG